MPKLREPHPKTVAGDLANPPQALTPLCLENRWLVWSWRPGKDGEWTKPPFQADQPTHHAKNNDPRTWASRSTAVAAVLAGKAHGLGYVLTDSEIGAVDLDKCRNPETGAIEPWAQEILDKAPSTYHEVTVSGTGLRIIGTIAGEAVHRRFAVNGNGAAVEVYRRAVRYITVSGAEISHCVELQNIDAVIDGVVEQYGGARSSQKEEKREEGGAGAAGNGFDFDGTTFVDACPSRGAIKPFQRLYGRWRLRE
jgi:primase-polymerase (primpol)-like protein